MFQPNLVLGKFHVVQESEIFQFFFVVQIPKDRRALASVPVLCTFFILIFLGCLFSFEGSVSLSKLPMVGSKIRA